MLRGLLSFFSIMLVCGAGLVLVDRESDGQIKKGGLKKGPIVRERTDLAVRGLRKVQNPEVTALMMNMLARYANDAPDKTDLDRKLSAALSRIPKSKAIAQRMVKNFEKLPLAQRQKVFGGLADATKVKIDPAKAKSIVAAMDRSKVKAARPKLALRAESLLPAGKAGTKYALAERPGYKEFQPKDPPPPPPAKKSEPTPPAAPPPNYTINFKGILCRDETSEASSSDEIYVITSVMTGTGTSGVTKTEKHPYTQDYYHDVDRNEWRDGPVAACWTGPAQDVVLVIHVFEQDHGDPNFYKDEIQLATQIAITAGNIILGALGVPLDLSSLVAPISDLINTILGTADDLVETRYVRLTPADFAAFAGQSQVQGQHTGIWRHFETEHTGDGGQYRVYFDVIRN